MSISREWEKIGREFAAGFAEGITEATRTIRPLREPPDVQAIDARPEAGDITIARRPRAQKKDPPK